MVTSIRLCFVALCSALAGATVKGSWNDIREPPAEDVRGPLAGRPQDPFTDDHRFSLKHVFHHGTSKYPQLHRRLDVDESDHLWMKSDDGMLIDDSPLTAKSRSLQVQRLEDRRPATVEALIKTARMSGEVVSLSSSAWTIDELPGPNVTDKATVLTLARMSANAYDFPPNTGNWKDVEGSFNYSNSFGWESDGLRGHIFAEERNSTIVIAIKGTSAAAYDSGGTETNDKINDNLFFSCCCGQGGHLLWRQVCDCASSTFTCNSTCLVTALRDENRYYRAVLDLYSNVTALYPDSTVWVTGHSLGGSVGSLLGLTYGLPVVTFEAPPEALAASRLGLPSPPGSHPAAPQTRNLTGAYHFGNTADPIYMGICNGATSGCTWFGYALESQCHTGEECIYDTVTDKGWRVGITNHRMHNVIENVLKPYDNVPACSPNLECVDCFNWKYFESNGSESTTRTHTTTSSTSTRTRTSTCKTPGWWGCLDDSTTSITTTLSTPVTTTITTTTTSTTCLTPGWFGCKDRSSTTITSTTTQVTSIPITTVTTTPRETITSTIPRPSTSLAGISTSCISRGWFGNCRNETLISSTATSTRSHITTTTTAAPARTCPEGGCQTAMGQEL